MSGIRRDAESGRVLCVIWYLIGESPNRGAWEHVSERTPNDLGLLESLGRGHLDDCRGSLPGVTTPGVDRGERQ